MSRESIEYRIEQLELSGDYLEIHTTNTSGARNITVDQMNFVITEIK